MRRYFPGLNALRAYAALSVVFGHLGVWAKVSLPLDGLFMNPSDAVTLFFVLSGFLIGYVLLDEKARTGNIRLSTFYQRRARRILPLYFLVIVLTCLLLPDSVTTESLTVVLTLTGAFNSVALGVFGVYWSLAVEEQFYLFAPHLLKRVSVPALVVVVIVVRGVLVALFPDNDALKLMRFDAMMLGVLGAWMVVGNHRALVWVYRLEKPALLLALLSVVAVDFYHVYWYDIGFAVLSLVIVLNTATKPRALRISRGVLDTIGQASYGIYLYHTLFILLGNQMPVNWFSNATLYVIAYYAIVVGGVLLVAHLSYRFFEVPVLKMRIRVLRPSIA